MKSHKRLTLLTLAVLGLSSQVVLADDTSHSTTNPITSSTNISTNTSTSNPINSSTNTSASSSQANTETSSSTSSSNEQETKPSLSTETKPNQPIQTGWVKEGTSGRFIVKLGSNLQILSMMVISLIVMAICLKTTGTRWEIIGTISMVQVNIYPTNGAK